MQTFPKDIGTMWNANSLVKDLNSGQCVHFLWGYPSHYEHLSLSLSIYIYIYIYIYLPFILQINQDEQNILDTAEEARTNSKIKFSWGVPLMDTPMFTNQQRFMFISFMWILDATERTCQEQWTIGTDNEREFRESTLPVQLDNDIYMYIYTRIIK